MLILKVNAAKERCKRLTGSIPAFNAMPMSEATSMGMPLLDGSPSELSADAYVPVQEDPNNFFFQPTFNNPMSSHDMRGVNNGLGGIISSVESVQKNTAAGWNEIGRTNSLPRVDSFDHQLDSFCGDAMPKKTSDRTI
jgi:hypothetical protein